MALKGDLHCHSNYSDGTCDLWELAYFAEVAGLNVLALSDHDTMAGLEGLRTLCKAKGIQVLPAMEITCYDYKRSRMLHMLCYYPRELTLEIARQTNALRFRRQMNIIERLQEDYPLSLEHIQRLRGNSVALTQGHIRLALEQMGYAMRGDAGFMKKLLDKNGKYWEPHQFPDVLEVVKAIKEEGSLAVIAHPGEFDSMELAAELAEKRLIHGLEIHHPRNSEETKQHAMQLCMEYELLVTGGTDFHGANNETLNTLGTFLTPEDSLQKILEHRLAY